MTETQWQKWLRSSHGESRCLLVILNNSVAPVYLSSQPYTSFPFDTLPDIAFRDCLTKSPEISNDDTLELGDLEFTWPERIAELRSRYWRGYEVNLYLGSPSWSFDDFKVVYKGLIERVSRTKRDRLGVDFASFGMALEQSVAVEIVNNTLLPVCLGSVKNISPVLIDEDNNEYAVHDDDIDSLVVRVKGETVNINNLGGGRFRLDEKPSGKITADVITNNSITVQSAFNYLLNKRGVSAPVFNHFTTALLNSEIGYFINNEVSYYEVIEDIAESIGSKPRYGELGELNIAYLDYSREADHLITDDDVVENEIAELDELKQLSNIIFHYNENNNVQEDIQKYGEKWQSLSIANNNNEYPDNWRETLSVDSYFTLESDANRELQRLAEWRFTRRIRYRFTLFLKGVVFKRGDRVAVKLDNWGLSFVATITSIPNRRITKNRFEIEVIA